MSHLVWPLLFGFLFQPCAQAESLDPGLTDAVTLLSRTKRGAEVLSKAREARIPIVLGEVSKTDLTITRIRTGEEERCSTETRVVIAKEKNPTFQALDLAHELVHATVAKPNPFDPELGMTAYIQSGIEGEGGEAQAIQAECEMGRELVEGGAKRFNLKSETLQLIRARCEMAWKALAEPKGWIKSFYNLGHYYYDFFSTARSMRLSEGEKQKWKSKVALRSPLFASAVTHKPYPLALLEEYIQITRKICAQSNGRGNGGRSPANFDALRDRCDSVGMNAFHE